MDISRRTDYALRMIDALMRDPDGIISVRAAAQGAGVPYSFARSIQHDLGSAGIVENSRGASGGMRLAIDPREVTLLQLVEAVQGPVVISDCIVVQTGQPCPNRARCHFTTAWCTAELMLRSLFSRVTLYELVVEGLSPVFDGTFELVPEDEARIRGGFDAPSGAADSGEKNDDGEKNDGAKPDGAQPAAEAPAPDPGSRA